MAAAFLITAIILILATGFFLLRPLVQQLSAHSNDELVARARQRLLEAGPALDDTVPKFSAAPDATTAAPPEDVPADTEAAVAVSPAPSPEQILGDLVFEARGNLDRASVTRQLGMALAAMVLIGLAATLGWEYGRAGWNRPSSPSPMAGISSATPSGPLDIMSRGTPASAPTPAQSREMSLVPLAERLRARLDKQPNDGDGWVLLGRTYGEIGKYADAISALHKAVELKPKDAAVQADLADAELRSASNKWTPEAKKALRTALQMDPNQPKALLLAGREALERGDRKGAETFWMKLLSSAAPDSPLRKEAEAALGELKGGAVATSGKPAEVAPAGASGAGASLSSTVDISDNLRKQLRPGDVLYVLTRAADGPPMPLAVKRFDNPKLPMAFVLDKDALMVPGTDLGSTRQLVLIARISHSGTPAGQPGDFEGQLTVGANRAGLKLSIDKLR